MTHGLSERIVYRFHLDDTVEEIALEFDAKTFDLLNIPPGKAPAWAKLDFQKCPHCPLDAKTTPDCPFAKALAGFVECFANLHSYEEADIEVVARGRTVLARKPLQRGIASLIGLIGATSGCPHLAFFRPMARFHLPFADDDETLYRVLSMYLLGCSLTGATDTMDSSMALVSLSEVIEAVNIVNTETAERLRWGFPKDAVVNAIVILDCFVLLLPTAIEEDLQNLRADFAAAAVWPKS